MVGNESEPQEPGFSALGSILGRIQQVPTVRLNALWAAAAGPLLAQHTRVAGRGEDSLRIESKSAEWLVQIRSVEAQLVLRLQELGLAWVQRLAVEQRNPVDRAVVHQQRRDAAPETVRRIQSEVAQVRSPSVRRALERLLLREAESGEDPARPA